MQVSQEKVIIRTYASESHPEVFSNDDRDREIIEWLDKNPIAFNIVTGTRSRAFGRNSCVYIGWAQRNNSVGAILQKLTRLKAEIEGRRCFSEGTVMAGTIWDYRAQFTFRHYRDKGFQGGLFRQWIGEYSTDCLTLDYTPKLLDEVVKKFIGWCRAGGERITIQKGKKVVEDIRVNSKEARI